MDLFFNQNIADKYSSPSQKVRVLSEDWVLRNVFCPFCFCSLKNTKNNTKVLDFICENKKCNEHFELKSSKNKIDCKVTDGAYATMIEKLYRGVLPNFLFLRYHGNSIVDLIAIPSFVFVPDMVEKRKPLSPSAKRSGWVGCNILTKNIPESYKVYYIKDCKEKVKHDVVSKWKKSMFLKKHNNINKKSWLLDIVRCIESLNKKQFILSDIYEFEEYLSEKHPDNKYVKAKIRQQLQVLRDNKYLEFISKGHYKLI